MHEPTDVPTDYRSKPTLDIAPYREMVTRLDQILTPNPLALLGVFIFPFVCVLALIGTSTLAYIASDSFLCLLSLVVTIPAAATVGELAAAFVFWFHWLVFTSAHDDVILPVLDKSAEEDAVARVTLTFYRWFLARSVRKALRFVAMQRSREELSRLLLELGDATIPTHQAASLMAAQLSAHFKQVRRIGGLVLGSVVAFVIALVLATPYWFVP